MTYIGIAAATDGSDRAALSLSGGPLRPRVLKLDAAGARIALVATSALLLGNDHVEIDLSVGPGAWLEVVDTAGTVAYNAGGQASSWTVRIEVASGGSLEWKAEPMIVADGANVTRTTTIELAVDATASLRETIVLGRSGERGGSVRTQTRVHRVGAPILIEDLDLSDPLVRELPGILGGTRILDTAMLLGIQPPTAAITTDVQVFRLARGGLIARYLGVDLHRSAIPDIYSNWVRSVTESRATGTIRRRV